MSQPALLFQGALPENMSDLGTITHLNDRNKSMIGFV